MYLRMTLMITGDYFYPKNIIKHLKSELIVEDYSNLNDLKKSTRLVEDYWQYGFLNIVHANEFSDEYYDEQYEESFVSFIEDNYKLLRKSGAESFDLMIDVYCKEQEQCNFEIFDKKRLRRLCKYNVSLPISIYLS